MPETDPAKVADALPDSWVYRLLPHSVWPYAQLARWERPIGWWLLLWPCWWSVVLGVSKFGFVQKGGLLTSPLDPTGDYAWATWPILGATVVFLLLMMCGSILMRGAGCTYNDLVDVELDMQVARTASRPIPSGRVSKDAAWIFLVGQALGGFVVLILLCLVNPLLDFNTIAFFLGIASLLVVALYPFAKRITDWPQFVLGLAFSWGALMGWAVVFGSLSTAPVLLYAGSILWVIGYDTIYA
ncbi:MAG: UbiA family prenyltransferase, partial [Rhizobiaceae bacterium]